MVTPITNALPLPVCNESFDGVQWIAFRMENGFHSEFVDSWPCAVQFQGKSFVKMSYNSDSLRVVYKESSLNDIPLALSPVRKNKIGFKA